MICLCQCVVVGMVFKKGERIILIKIAGSGK